MADSVDPINPKTEDIEKTRVLGTLLSDAKAAVSSKREQDAKDFDMYLGKQDIAKRSKRRRANTKTNFLFAQIETMKPILTQNLPTAELRPVPRGDGWKEVSEKMTEILGRIHRRNQMRARYTELLSNALTRGGLSWFKVIWNKELLSGFGDLEIKACDPRVVFSEPGKDDLRGINLNYLFEVTSVNELTLLRKYPEKKEMIRELFKVGEKVQFPEMMDSGAEVNPALQPTAPGAAAATTTERFFEAAGGVGGEDRLKEIELVEAWFHDGEMVEQEIEIQQGDKKVKKKKLVRKYPYGRLVQYAGRVIFLDKRNDFPGIPYIPFFNYRIPGLPGGMSELRQIASIQSQYNVRNNQLFDLMNYAIGPIRYYDRRSGLDPNTVTNAPNQWIYLNDVNAVRTEDQYRLGSAPFESLEREKQNIETVTGVREITQGTIPGDIRSGAAIEALQEAADVRLRGKSGELEITAYDLTRFEIDMIVKFYKHGIHYRVEDELRKTEPFKLWEEGKLSADFFDIEIRAGVNLPRSRIAQQQLMQWMYDRGMLDEEYVVNHTHLEDKEDLIDRKREEWALRNEARLLQAQQVGQEMSAPQQGAGGPMPVQAVP